MNPFTVRIASFDGATSYVTQNLPSAVSYRVNQVLRSSTVRWTGRGLPPVTLTLRADGQDIASITLSAVQLHPHVLYRTVAAAVRSFDAAAAEGWAIVDTASDAVTPQG
jgi:hypothetical protein